jgi:hypothetical protein
MTVAQNNLANKNKMANQVLRTIYIDPALDNILRTEAFDTRTSKNDLINEYLFLGIQAKKAGSNLLKDQKTINELMVQIETLLNTIEKLV